MPLSSVSSTAVARILPWSCGADLMGETVEGVCFGTSTVSGQRLLDDVGSVLGVTALPRNPRGNNDGFSNSGLFCVSEFQACMMCE